MSNTSGGAALEQANQADNLPESRDTSGAQGVGKEAEIYTRRFSKVEEEARSATWDVLMEDFLSHYYSAEDVVVDIGAGDGHFITRVNARRRVAVDLSSHVHALSDKGVEVLQVPATEFADLLGEPADVLFMSNFLEHLPDKRVLLEVFEECRRALRPGGSLIILQPNIRYVGPAYWDYIDHHIALTEHSLREALEVSGFDVVKLIPQFLPYTAKSNLGRLVDIIRRGAASLGLETDSGAVIRWYLKFPALWKILGKQTFVVATPSERAA